MTELFNVEEYADGAWHGYKVWRICWTGWRWGTTMADDASFYCVGQWVAFPEDPGDPHVVAYQTNARLRYEFGTQPGSEALGKERNQAFLKLLGILDQAYEPQEELP